MLQRSHWPKWIFPEIVRCWGNTNAQSQNWKTSTFDFRHQRKPTVIDNIDRRQR